MLGPVLRALSHRPAAAILIILEVGFGFAVSVQAFVLGRWFDRIVQAPSGIDANAFIVTAESAAPRVTRADQAAGRARDLATIAAVPEVASAGAARRIPNSRTNYPYVVHGGGRLTPAWPLDGVATRAVLGVPLLEGRDLEPADAGQTPTPVLVNLDLARYLFPDGGALGRTIELGRTASARIVGIVGSMRAVSAFAPCYRHTVFLPDEPDPLRSSVYLVRARPEKLDAAMAAVNARLATIEPARALEVQSFVDLRRQSDASGRGGEAIFTFMVVVVILVVLTGSFGMVSFLVAERTQQIGLRRALGARRRDVVQYFMMENAFLTFLGILLGLPLCYGLNVVARLAQPDLFLEWQPIVFAAALFLATADAAAIIPALRAARVPPTVASKNV